MLVIPNLESRKAKVGPGRNHRPHDILETLRQFPAYISQQANFQLQSLQSWGRRKNLWSPVCFYQYNHVQNSNFPTLFKHLQTRISRIVLFGGIIIISTGRCLVGAITEVGIVIFCHVLKNNPGTSGMQRISFSLWYSAIFSKFNMVTWLAKIPHIKGTMGVSCSTFQFSWRFESTRSWANFVLSSQGSGISSWDVPHHSHVGDATQCRVPTPGRTSWHPLWHLRPWHRSCCFHPCRLAYSHLQFGSPTPHCSVSQTIGLHSLGTLKERQKRQKRTQASIM